MSLPTHDISSSTEMDNSDGFEEVAQLGQALISQLEGFDDDICSAWMAHHLARLIEEAKNAPPATRAAAEDRCRAAVLEVWRQRRNLNSPQPLASVDETLDAVRALRSRESRWYFSISAEDAAEGSKTLELAYHVESGARAILRYLLAMSFVSKAQNDQQWFEAAISGLFGDVRDMEAVRAVIEDADALFKGDEPLTSENLVIREDIRHKLAALARMAQGITEMMDKQESGPPSEQ